MIKHKLILLILLFSFNSLSQDLEHQIGLNLTGEYYNLSGFPKNPAGPSKLVTGLAVSYTNQKRYISLGSHFYNPITSEFKLNEFDIQYRYYPNTPLRTFNLFFCLGLDYKFFNSKYRELDYTEGNIDFEKVERIIGVNFGFGFQVNLSDHVNFYTSISNYMYINNEDISKVFENTQVSTSTNSSYFYALSDLISFGVTYNFNIAKDESSEEF